MFKKISIIFGFLLFTSFSIFSEENEIDEQFESSLSETHSLLPTTVHNVSVLSGEWIDSTTDFYIAGPEPLSLTRCYGAGYEPPLKYPKNKKESDYRIENPCPISDFHCGTAWFFNRPARINLEGSSARKGYLFLSSGMRSSFIRSDEEMDKPDTIPLILDERKGLSNCMSAEISARTNPNNVILYYNEKDHHCSAVTGAGHITYFSKTRHFAPADFEQKPSGNYIVREGNSLTAMNSKTHVCYSKLTFKTESEALKITASDGKEALYKFDIKFPSYDQLTQRSLKESLKEKNYREDTRPEPTKHPGKTTAEVEREQQVHREYFLTEINFSHKPKQNFEYTDSGKLETIHYPNNRFISLSYFGKRIRAVKGPIGTDPTPIKLYGFSYKVKKSDKGRREGCVTVLNALHHKTKYIQNKEKRLIAHKKYLGNSKGNYSLYSTEEYVWDDDYDSVENSPSQDLVRILIPLPPLPPIYPGRQIKNFPNSPKVIPPQPQPPPNPSPVQEEKKEDVKPPIKHVYTLAELIQIAIEAKAKRAEKRKKAAKNIEAIREMIQNIAKAQNPKEILEKYIATFYPGLKKNEPSYTPGLGNLLGKYIKDSAGDIHLARFFDYDEDGNILVDTTYGNLTGRQTQPIQIDRLRHPLKEGEFYSKQFAYSDDGLNLLLMEKEDSGKSLLYFYYPGTDLLAAKVMRDKEQIHLREFYEYDDNAVLIKKIRDNGISLEKEDLTQVTERRITYITPTKQAPIGLPETILETFFDFDSGKEKTLSRVHCVYSLAGKLLKKDCFDAKGNHHSTWTWDYDAHDNEIQAIDPLGKTILKKYDDNDNLSFEQGPNYIKEYIYDYSNRLIALKETRDAQTGTTSYEYDVVGNRTSTIDRFGHQTHYEYDELNRLTKTVYPSVLDEKGNIAPYTSTTEYDIFNRPILVRNPQGSITTTIYNAYGKPVKIEYPDKTSEHFEYSLSGSLTKSIAKNGAITEYTRDGFGRILVEEIYSPSYEKLSHKIFTYKGARLISSTDPEGCVTCLTYDGAGRLIETSKGEHKRKLYYNDQGQIAKQVEHSRVETFAYDLLGRVTEEKVENLEGQILRKVSYSYDVDGNRETVHEETEAGSSLTHIQYNAEQKPIQVTDALGQVTRIHYDYQYKEYGIPLFKVTTTDPAGKATVQLYDALGRLVKNYQTNAFGVLLAQQQLFYDSANNLTRTTDAVIEEGKSQKEIRTLFGYNAMNAQVSLIEGAGAPEQKITYIKYNALGEKEVIIKPNRTSLHHSYDPLGRLKNLYSSDGTLDYEYTYNGNHLVTKVLDKIHRTETIRRYDIQGRLQEETLCNGLGMKYFYDSANQLTQIELPDQSGIEYTYDAASLKGVHRLKNKQKIYSHLYQEHDKAGNLLQAQTIHSLPVRYKYDSLKRATQISTPYWSQVMPRGAYDVLGRLTDYEIQDAKGKRPYHFSYNDRNSLISEQGHQTHNYTADSLHNRTSKDGQSCSLNALNQLLVCGSHTYTYDQNGNLIEKIEGKNTLTFSYDALDRLISVTKNGLSTHYQYDAFNRRTAKIQDGKIQKFLYQGQDEIGSTDERNQLVELRILGKGIEAEIGAAVAFEIKGEVYAPTYDHNGNVVCLTNSQGIQETYRYTAFGEEEIFDKQGRPISDSKNPWRYTSKRVDGETGFIYFGRRYYDPGIGRWVTADPAGYADGPNLYTYLHHSPLLSHDAYGLYESCAYDDANKAANMSPYMTEDMFKSAFNDNDKQENNSFTKEELTYLNYFETLCMCTTPWSCLEGSSAIYDLQKPKKKDKGIGFINGIWNRLKDTFSSSLYLSKLADGMNIDFVYNATHYHLDLLESALGLMGISTEPTRLLHKMWDHFFQEASDDAKYLMVCHSQGAIHTYNALLSYPEDLRKKILVVAIAPAKYIDDTLCGGVIHYRNESIARDFVPHLSDISGARRCENSIVNVKSHPNASMVDHSFQSLTYRDLIQHQINKYTGK